MSEQVSSDHDKNGGGSGCLAKKPKEEWTPVEVLQWLQVNGYVHTITEADEICGEAMDTYTFKDLREMFGFTAGSATLCKKKWNAIGVQREPQSAKDEAMIGCVVHHSKTSASPGAFSSVSSLTTEGVATSSKETTIHPVLLKQIASAAAVEANSQFAPTAATLISISESLISVLQAKTEEESKKEEQQKQQAHDVFVRIVEHGKQLYPTPVQSYVYCTETFGGLMSRHLQALQAQAKPGVNYLRLQYVPVRVCHYQICAKNGSKICIKNSDISDSVSGMLTVGNSEVDFHYEDNTPQFKLSGDDVISKMMEATRATNFVPELYCPKEGKTKELKFNFSLYNWIITDCYGNGNNLGVSHAHLPALKALTLALRDTLQLMYGKEDDFPTKVMPLRFVHSIKRVRDRTRNDRAKILGVAKQLDGAQQNASSFLIGPRWSRFNEDISSLSTLLHDKVDRMDEHSEKMAAARATVQDTGKILAQKMGIIRVVEKSKYMEAKYSFVYDLMKDKPFYDAEIVKADQIDRFDPGPMSETVVQARHRRMKYRESIRLPCSLCWTGYMVGGRHSSLVILWKIPEDPKLRSNEQDIDAFLAVSGQLPVFFSTERFNDFKREFGNVLGATVPYSVLRVMYAELTGDFSAAHSEEENERDMYALAYLANNGHIDYWPDARALLNGNNGQKFECFFSMLGRHLENISGAPENRHGEKRELTSDSEQLGISVGAIVRAVTRMMLDDPDPAMRTAPIPSNQLVAMSFCPRNSVCGMPMQRGYYGPRLKPAPVPVCSWCGISEAVQAKSLENNATVPAHATVASVLADNATVAAYCGKIFGEKHTNGAFPMCWECIEAGKKPLPKGKIVQVQVVVDETGGKKRKKASKLSLAERPASIPPTKKKQREASCPSDAKNGVVVKKPPAKQAAVLFPPKLTKNKVVEDRRAAKRKREAKTPLNPLFLPANKAKPKEAPGSSGESGVKEVNVDRNKKPPGSIEDDAGLLEDMVVPRTKEVFESFGTLVDVAGDGNCGFAAVMLGLKKLGRMEPGTTVTNFRKTLRTFAEGCQRDMLGDLTVTPVVHSAFVLAGVQDGYPYGSLRTKSVEETMLNRVKWWNREVLTPIFNSEIREKDGSPISYEIGAARESWFLPRFVVPLIVHLYKVTVVVYHPVGGDATPLGETQTFAPVTIVSCEQGTPVLTVALGTLGDCGGRDGIQLKVDVGHTRPDLKEEALYICSNGSSFCGHYMHLAPDDGHKKQSAVVPC